MTQAAWIFAVWLGLVLSIIISVYVGDWVAEKKGDKK